MTPTLFPVCFILFWLGFLGVQASLSRQTCRAGVGSGVLLSMSLTPRRVHSNHALHVPWAFGADTRRIHLWGQACFFVAFFFMLCLVYTVVTVVRVFFVSYSFSYHAYYSILPRQLSSIFFFPSPFRIVPTILQRQLSSGVFSPLAFYVTPSIMQ